MQKNGENIMKIVKKGALYPTLKFVCQLCGCEFMAGKGEYTFKQCMDFVIECYARCPNAECQAIVIALKKQTQ
jgi:hypothetical protein